MGRKGGKGVETEVSEETRLFQQLARVHSHGDSDAAILLPLGSPAISRNVPEHVVLRRLCILLYAYGSADCGIAYRLSLLSLVVYIVSYVRM